MQQVSADDIIHFIRSIEGQELKTDAQHKAFTVRTLGNGVEYIPLSTRKPRADAHKGLTYVCAQFSRTNSFKPRDYQRISANASYALAVIAAYLSTRSQTT